MVGAKMIEQTERVMSSAYMQWAKTHLQVRFNLASSGLEPFPLAKLPVKIDNLELEEHALLCSISEKNGGVRAAAVSSDWALTCVIMRLSPNRIIRSSCST